MVDAGAKMDLTIQSVGSALHLASCLGCEIIIRQLLERFEDIGIPGGCLESILIAALKGGHTMMAELLMDWKNSASFFQSMVLLWIFDELRELSNW